MTIIRLITFFSLLFSIFYFGISFFFFNVVAAIRNLLGNNTVQKMLAKMLTERLLPDCLFLLFVCCMCVCVCVCIYIFTYPFNLFFPSWYFSPSLPLQAAVAAAANTSSVTSATAGATGVPGGHPQGAPGSHSPGPASYNIPSVNEGTDWTDGYLLGKILQSYSFSVTCLSLEIFCFLDLLSYPLFFCLTFSSLSPSHLYIYIFIFPPLHSFFCLLSHLLSCSRCHHSSLPPISSLHQLFISQPFFFLFPSFLGLITSFLFPCIGLIFFLQPVLDFHLRCLAPVYCHVFVLVSVHSAVCLSVCPS